MAERKVVEPYVPVNDSTPSNAQFPDYDTFSTDVQFPEFDMSPQNVQVPKYDLIPANVYDMFHDDVQSFEYADMTALERGGNPDEPTASVAKMPLAPTSAAFFIVDEMTAPDSFEIFEYKTGASFIDSLHSSAEVLMVLKDTQLCPHSSYFGGDEREFHRGANGHTRHVTCKVAERD